MCPWRPDRCEFPCFSLATLNDNFLHQYQAQTLGVNEYYAACMRIFDMIYLGRMGPLMTPTMWKIAGVVSVSFSLFRIDHDSEIDAISKVTGLSVQTIFQILKGSQHVFDVTTSSSVGQPRCRVTLKPVVRKFLLDESRSKNLYFAYRRSRILRYKSKIMLMSKCKYVSYTLTRIKGTFILKPFLLIVRGLDSNRSCYLSTVGGTFGLILTCRKDHLCLI